MMTIFIGWYGQGQLSVVTVLGTLRALVSGQSLEFLLFDPFSLLIWGFVILSFLVWGRGFFCGWLLWLLLGLIVFRGFCRYVCPLGAFMALGGLLRLRNWIPRRRECGSRCQLCAVRCQYRAIEPSGKIAYDECFQCLECVTIYQDSTICAPLVLLRKGKEAI